MNREGIKHQVAASKAAPRPLVASDSSDVGKIGGPSQQAATLDQRFRAEWDVELRCCAVDLETLYQINPAAHQQASLIVAERQCLHRAMCPPQPAATL